MTNREKAIEWWNNLSFEQQTEAKNEVINPNFPLWSVDGQMIQRIYNYYEGN